MGVEGGALLCPPPPQAAALRADTALRLYQREGKGRDQRGACRGVALTAAPPRSN